MGLVLNTRQPIDNLTYNYFSNSNKLSSVSDAATEPANMNLGDFVNKNSNGQGYGYDINGNKITDQNKFINGNTSVNQTGGSIIYNYLNLPYQLSIQNSDGSSKGTITYIYDASGQKLEKRVNELATSFNNNTAVQTSTSYLEENVYQNNVLQFFGQEEGRVRPVVANTYYNNQVFAYDYFIKDHLGNTRTLLTDELEQDIYPAATLENGGYSVESSYYQINQADIVSNPPSLTQSYSNNNDGIPNPDPGININGTSAQMYRLNGQTGDKTGLGITLKVMARDNVTIFGTSFWHNNGSSIDNTDYNVAISSLLTLLAGTSTIASIPEGGVTAAALNNSTVTPNDLSNWLTHNEPQPTNYPKAFINWVLFDNQFRPVTSGTNSGFDPVTTTSDMFVQHVDNVSLTCSGYLHVYCSNESNIDVFFDNLQVIQTRSPLLETNNYYPFGLSMAGISDKAVKTNYSENKYRFNDGTEIQNKEFSDGTGFEEYETDFRMYDPQIGRFWQIDPFAEINEEWSPFSFANNNPVLLNDPFGLLSDSAHPQNLAVVTVTAVKKGCKPCNSPTVRVGPPPSKPIPFNFIHWPDYTKEDGAGWEKDQIIYYKRASASQKLIQGGESEHYLESLDMYKQWSQAEREAKIMQYTAVGLILGPVAITSLVDAGLADMVLQGQQQAFVEAERIYNIGARDLIYSLRYELRNKLSIDQIIRLERMAEKYKDLNKTIKTARQIYDLWNALQKVLKGH